MRVQQLLWLNNKMRLSLRNLHALQHEKNMLKHKVNYYRPQRSCGQGNIFTPVCHSVHGGGGMSEADTPPGSDPPGQTHPGSDTPPVSTPPPGQMPPLGQIPQVRHPPGQTPLGQTPPRSTHPGSDTPLSTPPRTKYSPLD